MLYYKAYTYFKRILSVLCIVFIPTTTYIACKKFLNNSRETDDSYSLDHFLDPNLDSFALKATDKNLVIVFLDGLDLDTYINNDITPSPEEQPTFARMEKAVKDYTASLCKQKGVKLITLSPQLKDTLRTPKQDFGNQVVELIQSRGMMKANIILVGYSLGGLVGLEVWKLLKDRNVKVVGMVTIGSPLLGISFVLPKTNPKWNQFFTIAKLLLNPTLIEFDPKASYMQAVKESLMARALPPTLLIATSSICLEEQYQQLYNMISSHWEFKAIKTICKGLHIIQRDIEMPSLEVIKRVLYGSANGSGDGLLSVETQVAGSVKNPRIERVIIEGAVHSEKIAKILPALIEIMGYDPSIIQTSTEKTQTEHPEVIRAVTNFIEKVINKTYI